MAGFIRSKIPKDCKVYLTSDWHIGSKAHSDDAREILITEILKDENAYVMFGGDLIEGKPIGSKHYDPDSQHDELQTTEKQADYAEKELSRIKDKILSMTYGNHDLYIKKDYDWLRQMCRNLGIENKLGGYQTWTELGPHLGVFSFHGRRSLPKGAKDPVQRQANRLAWLKRELEDLATSCHVMLMGHVHWLDCLAPIESVGLFNEDQDVRRHLYVQPETVLTIQGKKVRQVPKESRWYGCTGTLRKSGSFDYIDYSEVAGHVPAAIGWLEMTVEGGRCVDITKRVV